MKKNVFFQKKYSVESLLNKYSPRLIGHEKSKCKSDERFVNVINAQLILPSISNKQTKTLSKPILWKSNIHFLKTPTIKRQFPMKPTGNRSILLKIFLRNCFRY